MKATLGRKSSGIPPPVSVVSSHFLFKALCLNPLRRFSWTIALAWFVSFSFAVILPETLHAQTNTGFLGPTANAAVTASAGDNNGYQTSPANAHNDDTLNAQDSSSGTTTTNPTCTTATPDTGKDQHTFFNYGLTIPNGVVINGIEVRLDAFASSTTGTPKICVQLSWNNGTTWTTLKPTATLTAAMATYTLGSATDTWGRTWSVADFTNANFKVKLVNMAANTSTTFNLDWVAVRVTYTTPTPPVINSTPGTAGIVNQAYSYQATATGTTPITWSLVSPPSGMAIGSSTGLVSWTPSATGSFPVTVRATNAAGSVDQPYTITVSTAADSGFRSPTANAAVTTSAGDNNGYQTSPANAHNDDTLNAQDPSSGTTTTNPTCTTATPDTGKDQHRFFNYGFTIPNGVTIRGIEVRLDTFASSTTGTPKICVQLSWNGGTTWTTLKPTATLTAAMATYTLGSATDTWGRSWSVADFTNANFQIRLVNMAANTSTTFNLDWAAVRVSYLIPPPPQIGSLSPNLGPVGTSVAIAGSNFGATTGTVTFNGTPATTVTGWTSASITAQVPANATSGPVIVTTSGGVAGSGVAFTVTPKINTLSPALGPVGTPVTISGSSFGGAPGTSTVTFNGILATPSNWSSSSITVPVPTGATTGNVVVTVSGNASNGVSFTVTPKINSLSPAAGSVGAAVTVSGTNFGATQGASTLTFNGIPAIPTSWSDTSIVASVPSGAATGLVVVTAGGVSSNGASFTVLPKIDSLSPVSGPVATSVTIAGSAFGATQGASTITFNSVTASVSSWSDTSIVASVPSGATTGPVVVTVGGNASNGMTFTVFPKIDSVSPASGQIASSVTISGANFGATQGTSSVTFNGTAGAPTSWGDTSIVVPVPSGATAGPVVVTVSGNASNGINFSVESKLAGTITRSSDSTPLSGALVEALQSGTVIASASTAGDGTYAITALSAGSYHVRVSKSGYLSFLQSGVAITAGNITTSDAVLPLAGALSGKVTQANGTTPIVGAAVEAFLGPTSAGIATTDSNGDYTIGSLPAGTYAVQASSVGFVLQNQTGISVTSGATTTVNFSLSAVPANNVIRYFYDELGRLTGVVDPAGEMAIYRYDAVGNLLSISRQSSSAVSIIEFTPDSGNIGSAVTISGTGFSTTLSENTVRFNGVIAAVNSATPNELVAIVPAGATTGPISVTTPTGSAASALNFTVRTSGVQSITPNQVLRGAAVDATITGTAFSNVLAVKFSYKGISTSILSGVTSTTIPVRITVSATVPVGSYTFSVITAEGAIHSGSISIRVTDQVPSFSEVGSISIFMPYPAGVAPSGGSMSVAPPNSVSMP